MHFSYIYRHIFQLFSIEFQLDNSTMNDSLSSSFMLISER